MNTILQGNYSPETAFVVQDYPYGFRLRCKIRYWVEYRKGMGCRMFSQTTNPKRGNIWNKEKASTYARFGLVMFLDESNGYVSHGASLTEYSSATEAKDFQDKYAYALPNDEARSYLDHWVKAKTKYEEIVNKQKEVLPVQN